MGPTKNSQLTESLPKFLGYDHSFMAYHEIFLYKIRYQKLSLFWDNVIPGSSLLTSLESSEHATQ